MRMISTPREVALGCGLSVRFEGQDAPRVLAAVERLRPQNMIGVYDVEKRRRADETDRPAPVSTANAGTCGCAHAKSRPGRNARGGLSHAVSP